MEKVSWSKIELPPKPQEPEVETWEDEGGNIGIETVIEAPETIIEQPRVEKSWQELVIQAKEEFPEEIKIIIDKAVQKEELTPQEKSVLDSFSYHWFRKIFGIKFEKKVLETAPAKKELVGQKRTDKKQKILDRLANLKRQKMENLHISLKNLDEGEPIKEFENEARRVVYYDEYRKEYFTEKNGEIKTVSIGDILSDYAWGINYVPDGEMVEPAYRTITKRILANETRRDLEKIHDQELVGKKEEVSFSFIRFKKAWENANKKEKESIMGQLGFIAEITVRELLSRVGYNHNLDFIVSRATIEEDREFKYDFKIHTRHRIRGVDVTGRPLIKSLGVDLKAISSQKNIYLDKTKKGKRIGVDEIIILKVPGKEIADVFKKWVSSDEPSGGPEQFLSRDLKIQILKAVTKDLVEIGDEKIEGIYPK